MTEGAWRCGFNARSSFGAHSYFVARAFGNLLVDSPRYTTPLVKWFEATGGISGILLSHRDDAQTLTSTRSGSRRAFGFIITIGRPRPMRPTYCTPSPIVRSRLAWSPYRCQVTRAAASRTCSTIASFSRATRSPGICMPEISSPFAMHAGIRGTHSPNPSRNSSIIALSGYCLATGGRHICQQTR